MTQFFAWLGRGVDWLITRINSANITNLRQVTTLWLVIGTGAVYLALAAKYAVVANAKEWSPSYEWLAFLTLMSGLDITQFNSKRKTDANYVAAMQSVPSPTTTTTTSPPGSVTTVTEGK